MVIHGLVRNISLRSNLVVFVIQEQKNPTDPLSGGSSFSLPFTAKIRPVWYPVPFFPFLPQRTRWKLCCSHRPCFRPDRYFKSTKVDRQWNAAVGGGDHGGRYRWRNGRVVVWPSCKRRHPNDRAVTSGRELANNYRAGDTRLLCTFPTALARKYKSQHEG